MMGDILGMCNYLTQAKYYSVDIFNNYWPSMPAKACSFLSE